MNVIIAVVLCFSLLGAIDKIIGGKMGLAEEFDRGISSMGPLVLSMAGLYSIGISFVQNHAEAFAALSQVLPFDPSVIIGSILAPDLGGFSISENLASSSKIGHFSGALITSTLGCTISFVIPISLSLLPKQEFPAFMSGILWGVVTIPFGLIPGGLFLGMGIGELWNCLWPVLIVCVILYGAIVLFPSGSVKVLSGVGNLIRIASIILFVVAVIAAYFPDWELVPQNLILESLFISLKITAVVCGSMVACKLAMRHCAGVLKKAAVFLGVNEYAVVGLFGCLATNVAMLPFFAKMDAKGKAMNAAFSVSGAFVFGGQLAFMASISTSQVVTAFLVAKLVGGIAAAAAAALFSRTKTQKQTNSEKVLETL
ncbi:MAG: ethanolamine utilization protein EutH [Massiliimalia sp.]|jgi:ethanolamine transporter